MAKGRTERAQASNDTLVQYIGGAPRVYSSAEVVLKFGRGEYKLGIYARSGLNAYTRHILLTKTTSSYLKIFYLPT